MGNTTDTTAGPSPSHTIMSNDQRIFALVSLGLFLAALLVPFIIFMNGRAALAVAFGAIAGLLAVMFGVLSWSDLIGRTVTIAQLVILIVGLGGSALFYAIRIHS
jgi:hypothetical protein